jgi:murein L,D-transpeptidase YcbB/YkuD
LSRFEATPARVYAGDQVDVAADALFDSLARSFARGATEPRRVDATWTIPPPPAPNLVALHGELAQGAAPEALLRALLPRSGEYLALRAELARVAAEPPGARNDEGLDRETRLARLRANMERWRWLPRIMPDSRIEVRVPAQQALFFKADSVASTHGVIVGARRTPTPTLVAELRSVTLNPDWLPPREIVRAELLPLFTRDPAAATRRGFEALDATGAVVDPAIVDWSARPFPYRVRQRPGPANALGRIRFDLPNAFSIYLHDTPNHALFNRPDRALSHGCIRVDDPLGLAAGVLDDAQWSPELLQAAIDTNEQQVVPLRHGTAVYILYLTAAIGDDGQIAYHSDLYRRDGALIAALDAPDVALVADIGATPRCPA